LLEMFELCLKKFTSLLGQAPLSGGWISIVLLFPVIFIILSMNLGVTNVT